MKSWYLLYHHERRFPSIIKWLNKVGLEHFMPMKEYFVARSDRTCLRKAQPKPLFPCYMFVSFDPEVTHTTKISAINGAICFVKSGGLPHLINEDIINELQSYPFELININSEIFETRNAPPALFNRMKSIYEQEDKHVRVSELMALLDIYDHHLIRTA